jgi:choline dehydrogenase-like flavoprotein
LIDARALARGSVLDADVCVVGAGAAGIVLGLRLAAAGHRTLLLEAGGMEEDTWTTDLFAGPNLGLPYFGLGESRAHRFGGTTYKYGGYSKPVVPRDFAPVPGVPLATWPIGYDDLAPWVDEALVLLGHHPEDFCPSTRLRNAGFSGPPSDDGAGRTEVFVRDADSEKPYPVRFAQQLHDARNLQIALHAVVTRVCLDPSGSRVLHLEAGSERGTTIRIHARHYVLACHAVENARLLLDSDDVVPQGIGNQSGLLGRCFMDHPHVDAGRAHFARGVPTYLVYPAMVRHGFAACISVPKEITDRAGCLQYFCRLLPVEHNQPGAEAVHILTRGWRHPRSRKFRRAIAQATRDPGPALLAAARSAGFRSRAFVIN